MRKILGWGWESIHVTVTAILIRNAISCWLLQPSYWCVCKLNFLMGVVQRKNHICIVWYNSVSDIHQGLKMSAPWVRENHCLYRENMGLNSSLKPLVTMRVFFQLIKGACQSHTTNPIQW